MCLDDEQSESTERRKEVPFDPSTRARTLVQLYLGTRTICAKIVIEIMERISEHEKRMEVRTAVAEHLQTLLQQER